MVKKPKKKPSGLPTKAAILEFIKSSDRKVGKREIARAFSIKGDDRISLKKLLREMADEGLVEGGRKKLRSPGELPPVAVIVIKSTDSDGEFIAHPVVWDLAEDGPLPKILVLQSDKMPVGQGAAGIGDRLLARLEKAEGEDADGVHYIARPMRRLDRAAVSLLGIYKLNKDHGSDGSGVIDPVDRKQLREWYVSKEDRCEADSGDLVRFEIISQRRTGLSKARITEVLGNPDDQKQISLIAIHAHGIPDQFPNTVMDATAALTPPDYKGREDLRDLPLITIDPADARDHDDAVWAEPDTSAENQGGWKVIVAIADVSHYVRPGSVIDKHAEIRGNSTYFPDRVVPMLPERISNDLCSLKEGEVRPCLAVRMVFDKGGHKKSANFIRAVMRSKAHLSYQDAQAAIDGTPNERTEPLLETVLKPLWGAYASLQKAQSKREPLALDLPERKIIIGDDGKVAEILVPERLDAHKLIEEFMIQANVAAAEVLEKSRANFVYRVHDAPSQEKLMALRSFLRTLDVKFPSSGLIKPSTFNVIMRATAEEETADLVSVVVLRSQSQAEYSAQKGGHFGLNLSRYAHFTSPIRRYADLIVHRALIGSLGFGDDGLVERDIEKLNQIAGDISKTERRSMAAERETIDRLIAAFLAERIGAQFGARIAGVTRSGLFVRLKETGADGFIPISTIGDEYFSFHENYMLIVGEDSRMAYRLGDDVEVRLVEAIASAGALRFEMLSPGTKVTGRIKSGHRGQSGRGQSGRGQSGRGNSGGAGSGGKKSRGRNNRNKGARRGSKASRGK